MQPAAERAPALERGKRYALLDAFIFVPLLGAAWLAIMAYEHRVHDWGMKFRLVHVPAAIRRIFELTATEYLLSEAVGA